ncbi:MAG: VWA domain-containing protein [Candidatus Promineifilaceae bacterium]
MQFLWPWSLLLLLIIPLLLALYWWILRRKRRYAVRYSSLSLIREALPKRSRWRQHLPFALFLLALASLVIGLARPAAEVEVPLNRSTIILALDVSRSMCATDVEPNRLSVAQEAARAFIADQDDGTQFGLVAFAGLAEIVVPPTSDKDILREAIDNFTTSIGTAIGSATLKSIDAISEVNDAVAASGVQLDPVDGAGNEGEFSYNPEIIVLLTDGANSRGPFPLDAAQQAVDRRIRIYTIGFGTDDPQEMVCTRQQLGSDVFNEGFGGAGGGLGGPGGPGGPGGQGGGPGNFRRFLVIDEDTLQAISDMTGGAYFRAEDADQLLEIFQNLPTQVELQRQRTEISVIFTALGALLILAALTLSMLWNRFP